jgi:NAD(P)H dehydrogenase (quinone)
MSRALGRRVHYEPVTTEPFIEEGQLKGWGDFVQQHVREVAIDYKNGVFAGEDGIIWQVTGQRPMSVETFIEKNRSFYER